MHIAVLKKTRSYLNLAITVKMPLANLQNDETGEYLKRIKTRIDKMHEIKS